MMSESNYFKFLDYYKENEIDYRKRHNIFRYCYCVFESNFIKVHNFVEVGYRWILWDRNVCLFQGSYLKGDINLIKIIPYTGLNVIADYYDIHELMEYFEEKAIVRYIWYLLDNITNQDILKSEMPYDLTDNNVFNNNVIPKYLDELQTKNYKWYDNDDYIKPYENYMSSPDQSFSYASSSDNSSSEEDENEF